MNMQTGQILPADIISDDQAIHIWRSKLLDQAAVCEGVLQWFVRGTPSYSRLHFKKLATQILEDNIACKKSSKGKTRKIAVLTKLLPLIDLRSQLAHSSISIVNIENERQVLARNASSKNPYFTGLIRIKQEDMESSLKNFRSIAQSMASWSEIHFNQASSQPPPSLGAAGGL